MPEPGPAPTPWTLQIYEGPDGSCPYSAFRSALDPHHQIVLDTAVVTFLSRQGHNVCNTEWGKALGRGLYEFRIRRSLATICHEAGISLPEKWQRDQPVLLRVFFAVERARIVLLLSGYDKRKDTSARRQDREIQRARKILRTHQRARRGK